MNDTTTTDDIAIADLLDELNELRKEHDMQPLASWKRSRAQLEQAIDKLDDGPPPAKTTTKQADESPPAPKKKAPAKKKKPASKKTGKKRGPQPKNDGLLSVSDVARKIGMDPKVARAKLRRNGHSATDGRWPRVKPDSKQHKELIANMQKGTRAGVKEEIK